MADREGTLVTPRRLMAVFVAAMVIRAVMLAVALTRGGFTPHTLANARDGLSYQNYARYMLAQVRSIDPYDLRVFPGYPALIAAVSSFGVPTHIAALGITNLSLALAAVCSAMLFRDIRYGWAMATLPPSLTLYGTYAMSEPPVLLLTVLGGYFIVRRARRKRDDDNPNRPLVSAIASGVAYGMAGAVRPVACFAVAGTMLHAARHRRWRLLLIHSLGAATFVALTLLFLKIWLGDPLSGVKTYATHKEAYAGHLFAWPFQSIATLTVSSGTPRLFKVYIWMYIIAVLLANGLMIATPLRARAKGREIPDTWWWAAPWLLGNTLFVLCVGAHWGFVEFHRFILPALPPLFWAYRRVLPTAPWKWCVLGAISVAVASYHCNVRSESVIKPGTSEPVIPDHLRS